MTVSIRLKMWCMSSRTLSRDELYKLVWSTPMRRLAKEFGLSDVGLAKVCRKHDIPTPPLGYWAKKEHGKKVLETPLPSPKEGAPATITIHQQPPPSPALPPPPPRVVQDPALAALIAETQQPENKILVAETLHAPHPLITAARKGFTGSKPDTYGLLSPNLVDGKRCLNINVSKGAIDRALRLLNALLKRLDKLGMKASYTDETYVKSLDLTMAGVRFDIRVREKTKRQPHVITEAEQREKARWQYTRIPSYDYVGTGLFELTLTGSRRHYMTRRPWTDSTDHRIEDDLTDIAVAVLELADEAKVARAEQERHEREERERAHRRYELQQQRQEEKNRIDGLIAEAKSWRKATLIREYLSAVRESAAAKGGIAAGSELDSWLSWAAAQADRIDPLAPSPKSVLDPHAELDRRW